MQEYRYMYEEGHLPAPFKSISFLNAFNARHLKDMLSASRVREYESGEVVIPEGAIDEWIFILLTGRVNIVKNNKEIAHFDQTGDIFGEMAVITNEPRSASVVASGKTLCLALDLTFVNQLSQEDKTACYAVLYRLFARLVAERLKSTSAELAKTKGELEQLKKKKRGAS